MDTAVKSTIQILLEEDGFQLPDTADSVKHINCINEPHYKDEHESLTIDTLESTYHCYGCGFHGNCYTYLINYRNWDKAKACRKLEELGWKEERIKAAQEVQQQAVRFATGQPQEFENLPEKIDKGYHLCNTHQYHDEAGVLVLIVGRYVTTSGKKCKRVIFTPKSDGGYWRATPNTTTIPEFRSHPVPIYRVADFWERIEAGAQKVLWLEDELSVDLLYAACDQHDRSVLIAASCAYTHKNNFTETDLQPLYGERILIVASSSSKAHTTALTVGKHLHFHGSAVKYVLPEGDTGYGIADAINESGWTGATKWLNEIGFTTHGTVKVDHELIPPISDTEYFRVLGVKGNFVILQMKETSEVVSVAKNSLCGEGVLCSLAPPEWWNKFITGEDTIHSRMIRFGIQSSIVQAGMKKGICNLGAGACGRGAARIESLGFIYNMGDRLLIEGKTGLLSIERRLEEVREEEEFIPGEKLRIRDDDNALAYAEEFVHAVMAYRWRSKQDGKAFLGWLVAGLVGGALRHRPMVWLQAPADSGKTWLLNQVVSPLMGKCLAKLVKTTEAGLARLSQFDSLPVYLDEFEPGEGQGGRQAFNSVLSLLRMASSGEGMRLTADPRNPAATQQFCPRFSALIASINKPNLSKADASRFFWLEFASSGVHDWNRVFNAITAATTSEKMIAIRTHIIRNTANIARMTVDMERDMRTKSTRQAQILAALSAGYSFLSGRKTLIETPAPGEEDSRDDLSVLYLLLNALIQVDKGDKLSITECLARSHYGVYNSEFRRWQRSDHDERLKKYASLYGFKLAWDDEESSFAHPYLLCAVPFPAMAELLSRSAFSNINLTNYLSHLPGASLPKTEKGRRQRTYIGGGMRYTVKVPSHILIDCGLIPDNPPDEFNIDKYD